LLERVAENTGRQDFTALELGRICVHALESRLFATQRQLATALGRDTSDISKAIALASLPTAVIAAFGCPSDLQYRHAKPLRDAVARDLSAVLAAAQEISEELGPRPPGKVLARLTRDATNAIGPSNSSSTIPLVWQETTFGELQVGAGGHVTIKIFDHFSAALGEMLGREVQAFYGTYISDLSNSRHQRRLGRGS
jgi:ParB family chromosome partitioning protein